MKQRAPQYKGYVPAPQETVTSATWTLWPGRTVPLPDSTRQVPSTNCLTSAQMGRMQTRYSQQGCNEPVCHLKNTFWIAWNKKLPFSSGQNIKEQFLIQLPAGGRLHTRCWHIVGRCERKWTEVSAACSCPVGSAVVEARGHTNTHEHTLRCEGQKLLLPPETRINSDLVTLLDETQQRPAHGQKCVDTCFLSLLQFQNRTALYIIQLLMWCQFKTLRNLTYRQELASINVNVRFHTWALAPWVKVRRLIDRSTSFSLFIRRHHTQGVKWH